MSDYWGEHTSGMECPCKPSKGGRVDSNGHSVFLKHKAPLEEITGPERDELIAQMNLKLYGQTEVIHEQG